MKKLFKIMLIATLVVCAFTAFTACNKDDNKPPLLFGKEVLALTSQMDTLTQLKNGSADMAVIDAIMAGYFLTKGEFAGTMKVLDNVELNEEQYGIAARKSDKEFMSKINEGLIALYKNGKMGEIARTYGLESEVIVSDDTTDSFADAEDNSWEEIVASKKIVIGYTLFEPIAYEENGKLKGYDIDLAKAVVAYLNEKYSAQIEVEFKLIVWANKETEIANGSIDLIWNGMTITPALKENLSVSVPYLKNEQVCLVKNADYEKYSTFTAFLKNSRNAVVAVENGSAAYKILTMEI